MTIDTAVMFNVPNLMGFMRLFMIFLMITQMRKRPIFSFLLCFGSGQLDMLDGRVARYYKVVSRFGGLLDHFIDRLTTQAQYFALAGFFPRYSMLFLIVSSIEMTSDLARAQRSLFFKELNISPKSTPLEELHPIHRFYLVHFEPFSWYVSDFFYWLLYFSAFVLKISKPLPTTNNLNSPTKSHPSTSSSSYRCGTIRRFINDFNISINALYIFITEFIRVKFGCKIDFSPLFRLFRLFMYISLLGAFHKSWINFKDIWATGVDMLSIVIK